LGFWFLEKSRRITMGGTYVFDLETNGFLREGTKIHCMVAINIKTREVHRWDPNDIKSGLDFLSNADHLIAHNGIGFDYPFIRQLHPDIKLPPMTDTLIMSRLIYSDMRDLDFKMREHHPSYALPKNMNGRHSLESWGYRLGNYKGDFGKDQDWKTYSPEMLEYCVQDCEVTLDLYEKLKAKEYSQQSMRLEHQFATIIHRQQQRGWAFDEKKSSEIYAELVGKRQVIKDSMAEMFEGWWETMKTPKNYKAGEYVEVTKGELQRVLKTKVKTPAEYKALMKSIVPGELKKKHTPFNPGSRQHIYRVFAEKYKWKPKVFTKTGEPKIDDTVLQSLKYPEAKVLSEYFLLDKRIGQLAEGNQAWLRLVRAGRIHGSVNTLGAVTGRCTHSHPNVAQTPANGVPYGKDFRGLFIASKGMVLVGADASGLELRCLAHYMAHWDKGAYTKVLLEGDVHSVNQEAAGLPTRDNAKTFIYGFLYGAGDAKIGEIVGSGRETGKFLKEKFLKTLPALKSLVSLVKQSAKKGYIKGLDGRTLKIRSEHAALNTLLQSAGAIVMKYALVEADRLIQSKGYIPSNDYEFVGNIHDEMQLECKPKISKDIGDCMVKAIENATTHFNFKCPLTGEYKIGESWKDTH
jgi:DNA polymerase I-like protein with 3'-5' exonuclease and polymerase domains